MTLLEMSALYAESAAALRRRIGELRQAARELKDEEDRRLLQRRITELTPLLQETRELAALTAHYTTGAITDMRDTRFDARSSEWIGDMTVWLRDHAEDNSEQLERLRRGLRRAREQELTPRQREMVFLYYDRGLKMSQIAQKLGVNRSTVSRTVKRAKQRLYRCLRYAL